MKRLIAFFEIPALDIHRATKFYEAVLQLKLEAMDWGEEKMTFLMEGEKCVGAISYAPNFKPSADGVLISLTVDNMEVSLAEATANGGKVHTPKTKIEANDMGYFALIIDSEGNKISLHSAN